MYLLHGHQQYIGFCLCFMKKDEKYRKIFSKIATK